jgi:hypothetical protein
MHEAKVRHRDTLGLGPTGGPMVTVVDADGAVLVSYAAC